MALEQVEVQAKYDGYIKRQDHEIARVKAEERVALPAELDYGRIEGLSNELKEKLSLAQPRSLAQASRIPGITPAALSLLLIHAKRLAGEREGAPITRKEPSAPGARGCPSQEKEREGAPLARERRTSTAPEREESPRAGGARGASNGVNLDARARMRLDAFGALVRHWNAAYSLVSRRDVSRLETRHIADSLSLVPWVKGARLGDVGSGAGFPGIPLAIAGPQWHVTLVERSEKKARFLRQVLIELEIRKCGGWWRRTPGSSIPVHPFDTVTARAVAKPPVAWEIARQLLRPGGCALLQSSSSPGRPLLFGGTRARRRGGKGGRWRTNAVHNEDPAPGKPMHVIAVANQKGGVGKTTTSVNLSASMALTGARTLLVDLDPQGNATIGCGVDKEALDQSTCEWLVGEAPLEDITAECMAGIVLAPSNADLTAAEVELLAADSRIARLRESLAPASDLASTTSSSTVRRPVNILTVNALIAADGVLIPTQCEYYASKASWRCSTRWRERASAATRGSPSKAFCGRCSTPGPALRSKCRVS